MTSLTSVRSVSWLAVSIALLFVVLALIGWRWTVGRAADQPPVHANTIPDRIAAAAPGWVDAAGGVLKLGARTEGTVQQVLIKAGAHVAAGALLLQLDDGAMGLAARAAALELKRQEQLHRALSGQRQRLNEDATRLKPLVAQQAEPATELRQLQAQIADLDNQVQAASIAIQSAHLAVEAVQEKLAHLQIRAPENGDVLRVLCRSGDSVSPGNGLVWFAANGPEVVRAELDERLFGRVRPGMRAEVSPEYSNAGRVYAATVQRLARVVGPVQGLAEPRIGTQDDRVVEVVLSLENNEMLIGQRVLVRILSTE